MAMTQSPIASPLFIVLLLFHVLLVSGEHLAGDLKFLSVSRKLFSAADQEAPSLPRHILAENNSTGGGGARRRRQPVIWVAGFVGGAVAGMLSGAFVSVLLRLLFNCLRGRYRRQKGPSVFSPVIKPDDLALLSNDDTVASMVLIGRGGSGEVFRARLADGKLVAVKKIRAGPEVNTEDTTMMDKRARQIWSEIHTVGYVRHRNLLPLLAHIPRNDSHLLVYEYMKNGTLYDAIRGGGAATEREFDWAARLRVAAGIAAGLEYLHLQHSPRIIHRDLKPANILLDDGMEARIADFGLAKAVADAQTHQTTSNVAGTVGFIAPEYHQTLRFTERCDVYSFGVVLATMVMGRMPSDEFFQNTEEVSMMNWLRKVVREGREEEALDERLRGRGCEEQTALVLKLALLCTLDDPKLRPNSKEVRCMLAQVPQPRPRS